MEGSYILDRFNEKDYESPFRFKHDYYMQSLNDFNIVDIMFAIENGYWCRIGYKHGTAEFETELLCFPIEIRVSSVTGREYLVFYEPIRRSYTCLRIEFIDYMICYNFEKVYVALEKCLGSSKEVICADIQNAKDSIKNSWGISTTPQQIGNAINLAKLIDVDFDVVYDNGSEYYILNRLHRERRKGIVDVKQDSGEIHYSISVTDVSEMKPWIRSLYKRIKSYNGFDEHGFAIKEDVKLLFAHMENVEKDNQKGVKTNSERWGILEELFNELGSGTAAEEHDKLLNEIFGVNYHVIAEVFNRLYFNDEREYITEGELDHIIEDALSHWFIDLGSETEEYLPSEIKSFLLEGEFLVKLSKKNVQKKVSDIPIDNDGMVYQFKYISESRIDLYKDVIPLTELEIRWLKAVLKDPKVHCF